MTDNQPRGANEARKARIRAERDLEESISQRLEVKEVAKAAVQIRTKNHFAELVLQAFGRAS